MNMETPAKLMVDEILKNDKVNPYTVLDIYLDEFKKVCLNYMKHPTPETDEAVFNGYEDGAGMPDIVTADFARKLERERDEAREALRALLKLVPRGYCDNFHHEKKDRHNLDQPCPLVARYNAKIKRAEEAAK